MQRVQSMMDRDEWLSNIVGEAEHIASREWQARAWLENGPEVGSPIEQYLTILEDYIFDLFFDDVLGQLHA